MIPKISPSRYPLLFHMPFGFAGGLHDRDTGLVRFGYRDYDPDVGRWTAKDPILFRGENTDLYGYCMNDPINATDKYGLEQDSLYSSMKSIYGLDTHPMKGKGSVSKGKVIAVGKIVLGVGFIIGGASTGAGPAIAAGITTLSDGSVQALIEWGFGGNTDDIPSFWWEMVADIAEGISEMAEDKAEGDCQ